MRGHYWLDAMLMETYIKKYGDTATGLENDEDHHEVGG